MFSGPMATSKHQELLENVYREASARNLVPLVEALADDAVWTIIGTTPLSGTFRGKQEIVERLLGPLGEALEDGIRFTLERFITEGEYVVMLARGSGVGKNTGLPYNNQYCIISRIVDGKIREMTDYVDTELVNTALFGF
jgi:uncharacterized protein